MSEGILQVDPAREIILLPLADGGDGFGKVMAHYLHTTAVVEQTVNAIGKPMTAQYEWHAESRTAIIELATASGLTLLKDDERNPLQTSSYGTGLLVKSALEKGAAKIILGVGGSATNDGGTGILNAIGYRFLDSNNQEVYPCGGSLGDIQSIRLPEHPVDVEFIIACDVSNSLLGKNGAVFTYGSQKGATENELQLLEDGMQNFAAVLEKQTGKSIAHLPGMGAAGGAPAGLMLLPNCKVQKGTDIILSHSKLNDHLSGASFVFTGEGSFDKQTLNGKVVHAVASATKLTGIPVIAICGKVAADHAMIAECGLTFITSICNGPMTFEESKQDAFNLVRFAAANITSLIVKSGTLRHE